VASPTDRVRSVLAVHPSVRLFSQQGSALPPPRPLHRARVRACWRAPALAQLSEQAPRVTLTLTLTLSLTLALTFTRILTLTPALILTLTLTLTVALTL
jgi:hypothetical protein